MNEDHIQFFKHILSTNSKVVGDCIEWTGKNNRGYGYFYAFKERWMTHRISFLINNSELPHDKYICHTCNNKKCINPEHLYAGTAKENALDYKYSSYLKEAIANGKKTKEKNEEIKRKDFRKYVDQRYANVEEVAKLMDVHTNTIYRALRNEYLKFIRSGKGKRASYKIPLAQFQFMADEKFKFINKVIDDKLNER